MTRERIEEHVDVLDPRRVVRRTMLLSLASAALNGCRSKVAQTQPKISFVRIPKADTQGGDKNDIIEGNVEGALPGQRLVLYAKSGKWWVQPLEREPFTEIVGRKHWTNATHLGTDYAALLVDSGYTPLASIEELPTPGNGVAAVASVIGQAASPSPTVMFSGYEWRLRTAPSSRGGTVNAYSPENIVVDASGALHLRVTRSGDKWTCAEVSLTRSLGYGSYEILLRDAVDLDPNAVFELFTWDYAGGPKTNNREMDVEVSRWGEPGNKDAQYVIQPYHVAMNVFRFSLPRGTTKHTFEWRPGRVSCRSSDAKGRLVAQHDFASGIPSPGLESVRMILFPYNGGRTRMKGPTEVVIEKFEYLP